MKTPGWTRAYRPRELGPFLFGYWILMTAVTTGAAAVTGLTLEGHRAIAGPAVLGVLAAAHAAVPWLASLNAPIRRRQ